MTTTTELAKTLGVPAADLDAIIEGDPTGTDYWDETGALTDEGIETLTRATAAEQIATATILAEAAEQVATYGDRVTFYADPHVWGVAWQVHGDDEIASGGIGPEAETPGQARGWLALVEAAGYQIDHG